MSHRTYVGPKFSGLAVVTLLMLQFVLTATPPTLAAGSAGTSFANGAFRNVWEAPDLPIAAQKASRSFTWGPEGWSFGTEPYEEAPGGNRLVQYFDKTRMEITKPDADKNDPYYVTNGLLVTEMVSGRVQLGNNKFFDASPSEVPVAGDAVANPGPTYRSFRNVASLNLDNKAPRKSGDLIKATIDRDGVVGSNEELGKYNVKNLEFNPELGHNIPDVFWTFMNQPGLIYQKGNYVNGPVINWVSAMGFPITEPYWSKVVVAGQSKDVLIQLFQRRVLTFTPSNPEAYRVEMGNVGAHYYAWRYPGKTRQAHWAVLDIINQANCGPITVNFSGQDTFSVEVPPNTTATYKLGPGAYHYSASGCGALPFDKDRTFDPDSHDQLTLYIA